MRHQLDRERLAAMERAVVGVISDTHGLLRDEARRALAGSDVILHAGDVGDPAVLDGLRRLAPVLAVRGNVDSQPWASELAAAELVEISGVWLYLVHDAAALDIEPVAAGVSVVVSGHSHRSAIERRGGTLFLNPGSAGPRRFRLPVTVAVMRIEGGAYEADLIDLTPPGAVVG